MPPDRSPPQTGFRRRRHILLYATNHDFPPAVITDAINRVYSAVQAGRISQDRLNASVARIQKLKAKYPSVV